MERMYEVISSIISETDLKQERYLVTDGYIDSFDIVTIIDRLEEEFEISIPVESMVPENFESVDAMYALVTSICGEI
ncbi:acyl carrier protein [Acutalibacter caecimuris]|uniref:acyl carrier protein n=1 Tax=Acutalibacter caecimuris TaxID=3093657 RepID=UPI002AC9A7EA|nr:acyl carrier protein [Acutalibacter sp. M00118]